MYFPYLRCKQFELIALREMVSFFAQKRSQVSPILEPVRKSGGSDLSSTFYSTVKELKDNNINFNIIINPRVGDFKSSQYEVILNFVKDQLSYYDNFQLCIIKDQKFNLRTFVEVVTRLALEHKNFSIIHSSEEMIDFPFEVKYHIINYQRVSKRYHRNLRNDDYISLDDYFFQTQRNSDYLDKEPTFFSDEFSYYKEDGFFGFSDYLTIGEDYSESGFAPFAVAIQISYIPKDQEDKMYIRHFTSKSNEDRADVAGKFEEALNKLIKWINDDKPELTTGLKEFQQLYADKHFPGLGYIKKLSTKHHLELVLNNMKV